MNTNPRAKTVICYGDSNTWGANPFKDERLPANVRWTGVLQDILGKEYEVISEGLFGRTFIAEDPNKPYKCGITHLKSILATNKPIDIIIVMLGTNDLKNTYGLSVADIANHLKQTIEFIKKELEGDDSQILVICPPPVVNPSSKELDKRLVDAPKNSLLLPPLYEKVAKDLGCLYLDAGKFINLENTDGYHMASEHHKILGEKVASVIK
ncbi:MAG: GDSL-type esterase/lipase family protein [Patescibacteria group bacterium]